MLAIILISLVFHYSVYQVIKRIGRYWNGPKVNEDERRNNLNWIENYIQEWPESGLADDYPELAKRAKAVRTYNMINQELDLGLIDEIEYNVQLEKILKHIDISKEIS